MGSRSLVTVRNARWLACGRVGAVLMLAAAGRAGATVITASPTDFTATEGAVFNGAVATFTDDNAAAAASEFNASIDWGDGTGSTAGTIASNSGAFAVLGQHTYADEGTFTVTVAIADNPPGTGTATAASNATVKEGDALSGSPVVFSAPNGSSFTGTVASFTDSDAMSAAGDFNATINWGDATTSAGIVTGSAGTFQVSGTHTYAGAATYSVVVTLSDDPPGTATAQVTSTAKVGTSNGLSAAPVNFTLAEGAPFNGTVATFTDSDKTKTVGSFTATITWGDGTTSAGTITGAGGSFTVSGQHVYADEGSFTVGVTVAENPPGSATASTTGTAKVTEADVLAGTPATISPFQNVPFTGVVATFTDTNTANTPADFTAAINWGDGNVTSGVVTGGGGAFSVSGTHTYTTASQFLIQVTLTDDAPGTATASTSKVANVTAAPPPPAAVPALDWRGLLALVVALGAAGAYALRRAG